MCGLFGYSGKEPCDPYAIMLLALDNEARGVDSTGVYSKENGMWKIADKASLVVRNKGFQDAIRGSTVIMGHTRAGTHGVKSSDNAHPFVWKLGDGRTLALAHNGWLMNVKEQAAALGIKEDEYRVDSQLYGIHLINKKFSLKAIHQDIYAAAALSFTLDNRLYLYRKTSKPLYAAPFGGGIVYSSREQGLNLLGVWDDVVMLTPDVFYAFEDGEMVDTYYYGPSKIQLSLDCMPSQWYGQVPYEIRKNIPGENGYVKTGVNLSDIDRNPVVSGSSDIEAIKKNQPFMNKRSRKQVKAAEELIQQGAMREFATMSMSTVSAYRGGERGVVLTLRINGFQPNEEKWTAWVEGDIKTAIRLAKLSTSDEERRHFSGFIPVPQTATTTSDIVNIIIFNGIDRFARKGVVVSHGGRTTLVVDINTTMLIRRKDVIEPQERAEENEKKLLPGGMGAHDAYENEALRFVEGVSISPTEELRFPLVVFPKKLVKLEVARLPVLEQQEAMNAYIRSVVTALVDADMPATAASVLSQFSALAKHLLDHESSFFTRIATSLRYAYMIEDHLISELDNDEDGDEQNPPNFNKDAYAYEGSDEEFKARNGRGVELSYLSNKDGTLTTSFVYGESQPVAQQISYMSDYLQSVDKASTLIESNIEKLFSRIYGDKQEQDVYDEIIESFKSAANMFTLIQGSVICLSSDFVSYCESNPVDETAKDEIINGINSIREEVDKILKTVLSKDGLHTIEQEDGRTHKHALEQMTSVMLDVDTYLGEMARTFCEDLGVKEILPF